MKYIDFENYKNIISKNCGIVINYEKNIDIEKIIDYIFALIKFKNVDTFFFNSYGKTEQKIIDAINISKNILSNKVIKTVLIANNKKYINKFSDFIEFENNDKYLILTFCENIIYLNNKTIDEFVESCENSFKIIKIF